MKLKPATPFFALFLFLSGICNAQYYYFRDTTSQPVFFPLSIVSSGHKNIVLSCLFDTAHNSRSYHRLIVDSSTFNFNKGTQVSSDTGRVSMIKLFKDGMIIGSGLNDHGNTDGMYWFYDSSGGRRVNLEGVYDTYHEKFNDRVGNVFTGNQRRSLSVNLNPFYKLLVYKGPLHKYYTLHDYYLPDTLHIEGKSIIQTMDSNYAVGGNAGGGGFLMKLDNSLNPLWTNIMHDYHVKIVNVIECLATRNVMVCGQELVNGSSRIFLASFNSFSGALRWKLSYLTPNGKELFPVQMLQSRADSTFIIAGNAVDEWGNDPFVLVCDTAGSPKWANDLYYMGINQAVCENSGHPVLLTYVPDCDSSILITKAFPNPDVCYQEPFAVIKVISSFNVDYSAFATSDSFATYRNKSVTVSNTPMSENTIDCSIFQNWNGNGWLANGGYGDAQPPCFCRGEDVKPPFKK